MATQVTRENERNEDNNNSSNENNNGNEWVVTLIKKNWLQFTSHTVLVATVAAAVVVYFSSVCVALARQNSTTLDMISRFLYEYLFYWIGHSNVGIYASLEFSAIGFDIKMNESVVVAKEKMRGNILCGFNLIIFIELSINSDKLEILLIVWCAMRSVILYCPFYMHMSGKH